MRFLFVMGLLLCLHLPDCAASAELSPLCKAGVRGAGGPDAPKHLSQLSERALRSVRLYRAITIQAHAVPGGIVGVSARDPLPLEGPVTKSLRTGKYPWYDGDLDRVRPVWPLRISWVNWLGKKMQSTMEAIRKFFDRFHWSGAGRGPISGGTIATTVLLTALMAFLFWILMLWVRRERGAIGSETGREPLGTAARLRDPPEGIRPGDGDPWDEAQRRRAAGDLSGAIVCLFAHQLLTLDQLGLIRLAPGKTGRHYVNGLRDRGLVDTLSATLRLFEDVYYGRRPPTREAFESAWQRALMLEERRRISGVGVLP
jgi:hypothetical protein